MNDNIIKTQFFHKSYMTCHFYVMDKFWDIFNLRPSDLITIDFRSYGQLLSLFYDDS